MREIFVPVPLKILYTNDEDIIYWYYEIAFNTASFFNMDHLVFDECTLTRNKESDPTFEPTMKKLMKLEYINKFNDGHYIFEKNILHKNYALIKNSDIESILNSSINNKRELIMHFIYVEKSINYDTRVGFTSLEKFSEREGKPLAKIKSMNNQLKEMKLIAYKPRKKTTDLYSLYCEKSSLNNAQFIENNCQKTSTSATAPLNEALAEFNQSIKNNYILRNFS